MDEEVTPAQAYELDHRTCLGLLATQRLGRLVVAEEPPVVLLLRFMVADDRLVLSAGAAELAAWTNRLVLFEVDGVDEHQRAGWSVIVRGRLEFAPEAEADQEQASTRVAIVDLSGRWVRGANRTPPLDGRGYL